ncbi:unnamed protein product [Boreogadus saida]
MFLTVGDPASSRPVALRVNFVHKRVFLIVRHTLLTAPEQCGSASFTAAVVVVVASGFPLSQPQQYSSSPTQLLW